MASLKNSNAPTPLAGKNQPVDWFFAFKFNAATFPGCTDNGTVPKPGSKGLFGGKVEPYPHGHSQQYVFSTSKNPTLVKGKGCLGATLEDPLGASFAQVYFNSNFNYLIWNDQFYGDPKEFPKFLSKPWGHSKGMLAWNNDGDGFVLQVSTPSWPASGNVKHPRKTDGNTLGCIQDDDIEVSQHFFCLKINKADLLIVLNALINSSVVTNPLDPQISRIGGPDDVQKLAKQVGKVSKSTTFTKATLSSGVQILSKPSAIAAPVWQLVSSHLDCLPLRVASWWGAPAIYSTPANMKIACWPKGLKNPGAVEIALTGTWENKSLCFLGEPNPMGNHAKIGVSTNDKIPCSIFGDMNQEGTIAPISDPENKKSNTKTCEISQNARGGLFYVVNNKKLFESVTSLLKGNTAPLHAILTKKQ